MGAQLEAHRAAAEEKQSDPFVRRSLAKDLLVKVDQVSGEFGEALAIVTEDGSLAVSRLLTRAVEGGHSFHVAQEYKHPVRILVSRDFSPEQIAAFMQNTGNGKPASWFVGGPKDRSILLHDLARSYEAKK